METIKNKYGSIVFGILPDGKDMTIFTYDENGNPVIGRMESHKKRSQIIKEDRRLARQELLDLLCNRYEDVSYDVIEGLLYRIGYLSCDKNKVSNFYEIFEDLAYSFKADVESDVN
jgi:hypothetical protein